MTPETRWKSDQLTKVGKAEELDIASQRRDGRLRDPVTIWVVRHGDDLYVRAVNGRNAVWFRGVQDRHEGRIEAGGVEQDVQLVESDDLNDEIDAEYRKKYRAYAGRVLNSVLTRKAREATLKLVPRA